MDVYDTPTGYSWMKIVIVTCYAVPGVENVYCGYSLGPKLFNSIESMGAQTCDTQPVAIKPLTFKPVTLPIFLNCLGLAFFCSPIEMMHAKQQ